MTELQEKQLKLLNETVKFYNSSNRCTNEKGECMYFLEGKAGCAIGRLIEDKSLCKTLDIGIGNGISGVAEIRVFNMLPDNIRYYGQEFLRILQALHDWEKYWDNKGISESGLKEVQDIKIKFNLI